MDDFEGDLSGEHYEEGESSMTMSPEDRRQIYERLMERRGGAGAVGAQPDGDRDGASLVDSRGSPVMRGAEESGYGSIGQPDESFMDARAHRIAQQESLIRQEMFKDCTFRPQIKSLPSSYGSQKDQNTPFYQRVSKWQKDKEQDAAKRRSMQAESELSGCTFRPKINTMSVRAVKMTRGDSKETANERLFKSAEAAMNQKMRFLEEELRMEKEKEISECTFQPQRVTKDKFKEVPTKFNRLPPKAPAGTAAGTAAPPTQDLKECTFTPKVKGVASNMSSAKLYVSSNVIDRLSRPSSAQNTPQRSASARRFRSRDDSDIIHRGGAAADDASASGRPVMDVASFMGSLLGGAGSNNDNNSFINDNANNSAVMDENFNVNVDHMNNSGLGGGDFAKPNTEVRSLQTGAKQGQSQYETPNKTPRPRSAPRERTEGDRAAAIERQAQFEEFMDRQKRSVLKREEKLKEMERSMTPGFKPVLRSSSHEANQGFHVRENKEEKGEFLDRVERDVLRRSERERSQQIHAVAQHSFKPNLTKKTEKLPSRTTYEMSKQDALKKESHQRMMKLQMEKEMMSQATFKPEITSMAKRTNSKLALKEDPSKFLEMYKEQQEKIRERQLEELNRREEQEMEKCTFTPQTVECPEYIKRIARSMSVVRKAKAQDSASLSGMPNAKPEWRN